jgi:hypothetical protein
MGLADAQPRDTGSVMSMTELFNSVGAASHLGDPRNLQPEKCSIGLRIGATQLPVKLFGSGLDSSITSLLFPEFALTRLPVPSPFSCVTIMSVVQKWFIWIPKSPIQRAFI